MSVLVQQQMISVQSSKEFQFIKTFTKCEKYCHNKTNVMIDIHLATDSIVGLEDIVLHLSQHQRVPT